MKHANINLAKAQDVIKTTNIEDFIFVIYSKSITGNDDEKEAMKQFLQSSVSFIPLATCEKDIYVLNKQDLEKIKTESPLFYNYLQTNKDSKKLKCFTGKEAFKNLVIWVCGGSSLKKHNNDNYNKKTVTDKIKILQRLKSINFAYYQWFSNEMALLRQEKNNIPKDSLHVSDRRMWIRAKEDFCKQERDRKSFKNPDTDHQRMDYFLEIFNSSLKISSSIEAEKNKDYVKKLWSTPINKKNLDYLGRKGGTLDEYKLYRDTIELRRKFLILCFDVISGELDCDKFMNIMNEMGDKINNAAKDIETATQNTEYVVKNTKCDDDMLEGLFSDSGESDDKSASVAFMKTNRRTRDDQGEGFSIL